MSQCCWVVAMYLWWSERGNDGLCIQRVTFHETAASLLAMEMDGGGISKGNDGHGSTKTNSTAQDAINARKSAKKALKKKKKEELYKCPVNACELGRWKLYTTSLSIFVMPPKAKLNQQCSRYLQENTDYQDKVRFLFQAGLLSETHFRRGKPAWNEGDALWFPDFQAIHNLSDSPSNWMHLMNQCYHVASNHCS